MVDYVKHLTLYLDEEIAELVDKYIGLYCNLCGRTFEKEYNVYSIHDGDYLYYECIDKSHCFQLQEKTLKNPWRDIH